MLMMSKMPSMTAGRRSHFWLGLAAIVLCLNVRAAGQEPSAPPSGEVLQAEELGVSLARIQRRLEHLPDDDDGDVLRLNFYVQVYGRAPRRSFLEGFDVHNAPVPYGAPVHNELLAVMRPNPLYPPAVHLNSIAGWAWKALQP